MNSIMLALMTRQEARWVRGDEHGRHHVLTGISPTKFTGSRQEVALVPAGDGAPLPR
jgi:hypothetical protein